MTLPADRIGVAELAERLRVPEQLLAEAGAFAADLLPPASGRGFTLSWPRHQVNASLVNDAVRARVVARLHAVIRSRGVHVAGGPVRFGGANA